LVERRTETLDAGFERLKDAALERHLLPLDQLCDELIAVMLEGSERRDDVVLLALRTQVSSPRLFLRKETATPDALAPLRHELRDWLHLAGVSAEDTTDLLIATGEACMNAVQHAYRGAKNGLFRVEGARIGGEIILTVTDTGSWKEVQEGGTGRRGIRLMRELVPSVDVVRSDGGTSVTLRYPIKEFSDRAPVSA
jgi:anti-sigma regulatory factor (Ser/Thr protein kinase)